MEGNIIFRVLHVTELMLLFSAQLAELFV